MSLAQYPKGFNRLALAAFFALTLPAVAVEFTLSPTDDASIFDESGDLANSRGERLYVGQTQLGHDQVRRSLIRFNPSGLPPGAILLNAELRLFVDQSPFAAAAPVSFSLHPVQQFWQEGASDAGTPGGQGAPAGINDPTWLHNAYSNALWSVAGGDFLAASDIQTGTFGGGETLTFSSASMLTDIEGWINTPASNFGWIIIGSEGTSKSARAFASRENTRNPIPELVITYQIPEPGTGLLLLLGLIGLRFRITQGDTGVPPVNKI